MNAPPDRKYSRTSASVQKSMESEVVAQRREACQVRHRCEVIRAAPNAIGWGGGVRTRIEGQVVREALVLNVAYLSDG